VGIDGTRSILIYSHDASIPMGAFSLTATPPAATLSLSGVLPASVTTPVLQFTGLNVTSSGGAVTFPGPWKVNFNRGVTNFLDIIADKTLADVVLTFNRFDAMKNPPPAPGPSPHPLVVTSAGAGVSTQAFVIFNYCRVQMGDFDFGAPAPMLPPFVGGLTAGPLGATTFRYVNSVIETPFFPLSDDIASIWSTTGVMNVEFIDSTLLLAQVGGVVTVFAEAGAGVNQVVYAGLDVSIAPGPFDATTTVVWGARTDGENFVGPLTAQANRIRFLRSTALTGGLPLDMPNGCVADDPGADREVSWIKQSDPVEALLAGGRPQVWLTSGGGTRATRTTSAGAPTLPLALVNPGSAAVVTVFPLRLTGTDTVYRVVAYVSGAHIAVPTGALIRIEALFVVAAGAPALLGAAVTTVLVDTSGGAFTAVISAAAGGIVITASQGASGLASVLWNAELTVQEVNGS